MRKFLRYILFWVGILGFAIIGTLFSGISQAKAKVNTVNKQVEASHRKDHHKHSKKDDDTDDKPEIGQPLFSSPDKDNIYYDGDRITIVADYGQSGLNVYANLAVVDSAMPSMSLAFDNFDGTYLMQSPRLSGATLIEGSKVAVKFVAIDEAGHMLKSYSTYLVTIKLRQVEVGSGLKAPETLKIVGGDSTITIYWSRICRAEKILISYKDENGKNRQIIVSSAYTDAIIRNLKNGFSYTFSVAGIDKKGKVGSSKEITGTPVAPVKQVAAVETEAVSSPVIEPAVVVPQISSEAAFTKKPVITNQPEKEVEAAKVAKVTESQEENKEEQAANWNKLLLAISILIIAAGASLGGYYGYEWYMARKEEPLNPPSGRPKNRW